MSTDRTSLGSLLATHLPEINLLHEGMTEPIVPSRLAALAEQENGAIVLGTVRATAPCRARARRTLR